MDYNSFNISL